MRVQIISHKNKLNNKFNDYELIYSTINSPKSFDEFDVNIISLQETDIWLYDGHKMIDKVNCIPDFQSLQCIIQNSNNAKTIVAFPQNVDFKYGTYNKGITYEKSIELKDALSNVCQIIKHIVPTNIQQHWSLCFENTTTIISEKEYGASFYFDTFCKTLTSSKGSQKPTTIKYSDKVYFTSLNLSSSAFNLKDFLREIGMDSESSDLPEWLQKLNYFDDEEQNALIDASENEIDELNKKIEQANLKIQENLKYKSILSTNGEELVSVVFEILEKILCCDLSDFVDEGKQDFLIKKDSITFIGEIKGITSNVRSENVSQLDVHYQSYLEELSDNGINENVKSLLIINPFRTKPIADREGVNENQINLAKRNGCLIITTETLLKIFEKFLKGEVSTEKIIALFSNEIGLADIKSFE